MKHRPFCKCPECLAQASERERLRVLSENMAAAERVLETERLAHDRVHGWAKSTPEERAEADARLEAVEAAVRTKYADVAEAGLVLTGGRAARPHDIAGPYARFDPEGSNWIGIRAGERYGVAIYESLEENDPHWRATVTETWDAIVARYVPHAAGL